jgi:hypothetical protein
MTPQCQTCASRGWPCWYSSPEVEQKRSQLIAAERQQLEGQIHVLRTQADKVAKERDQASRARDQAIQSRDQAIQFRDQVQKSYEHTQQQWDQSKQELKAAQDEQEKTQKLAKDAHDRWKESQERSKNLENQVAQLQEKNFAASQAAAQVATHTTAQMSRQTPQPTYASHQIPPVSRTNTLPSYSHTASTNDRTMNPGYPTFYNQAPGMLHCLTHLILQQLTSF